MIQMTPSHQMLVNLQITIMMELGTTLIQMMIMMDIPMLMRLLLVQILLILAVFLKTQITINFPIMQSHNQELTLLIQIQMGMELLMERMIFHLIQMNPQTPMVTELVIMLILMTIMMDYWMERIHIHLIQIINLIQMGMVLRMILTLMMIMMGLLMSKNKERVRIHQTQIVFQWIQIMMDLLMQKKQVLELILIILIPMVTG